MINNYADHRPHSLIYQNREIVPDGTADNNVLCIIGDCIDPAITDVTGMKLISSTEDITEKLGATTVTVEETPTTNPVAFAATIALSAGGGKAFYVIIAKGMAQDAFSAALKTLSNTDKAMYLVPLTYDQTLIKLVEAHVETMSSASKQRWRRCYFPTKPNPASEGSPTPLQICQAVGAISASYNSERMINIWTSGATYLSSDSEGNITTPELDNMYIAAGIGAYRSSLLPQQGMSRKNLSWIYGVPDMYELFDEDELNEAAANGTFIITQDDEDSPVYIRHQLTTQTDSGVMYYEDSVGVNIDNICYGLKDIIEPFIGQRNATEETLQEIKNRVTDYLVSLTNTGVSMDDRKIGPQISSVDLASVIVQIDPVLKDRIVVSADVVIPLPINTIVVHLNAYASLNS